MSIVRRKEDRIHKVIEGAQGGPGHMIADFIINNDDELYGNGRLYNEIVLEKDCGVGYHVHNGDGELYVILSGEAEYNDNGTITTVKAGDITITYPGEGHAITNKSDEPCYFIGLILYAE